MERQIPGHRPSYRLLEGIVDLPSIQRLASTTSPSRKLAVRLPRGGSLMARKIRYTPEGGALFEITCRTIHSRFLFRPTRRFNEIVVGVLARAKRRYGVEISAFCCLSNHFHILARVDDSQQLSRFMGYVCSKLAREVGRLTGWREKIFSRRYQAILVSEEEAAQVDRLSYLLSHGAKENLVATPQDWPGVHCVDALLSGRPLEGTWFDRTKEYAARQRGEDVPLDRFATREILELDPLPCWRGLLPEQYRQRIAGLVDAIIETAAARRKESGREPAGAAAIRSQNPLSQPARTKRSPAPLVHAASKRVREEIYRMYALFVAAFREAAEHLKAGDRSARFPEGSFPPGLPFVKAGLVPVR
jgi:REP element-mobilizing transposase RayT